jgi:hypothetical protein
MFLEIHLLNFLFNKSHSLVVWDTLKSGVVIQMFFNCQHVKDDIILWAITYLLPNSCKIPSNVKSIDSQFSRCRDDVISQTLECCAFSSSINTK